MRTICSAIALTFAAHPSFAEDAQIVPKRLTADDLAVQTHKWDGKAIQTNAQCFYADKDDYRCGILGPHGMGGNGVFVRIDFTTISPPEMKKTVEDNCDTTDQMITNACKFQIVFAYSANDRRENNDGSVTMVITAEDEAGVFSRVVASSPTRPKRARRR